MLSAALALMLAGTDAEPTTVDFATAQAAYEPFFKCVRLEARFYALKNSSASATEVSVTANSDCASVAAESQNAVAKELLEFAIALKETRDVSEVIRRLDAHERAVARDAGIAEAVKARSKK